MISSKYCKKIKKNFDIKFNIINNRIYRINIINNHKIIAYIEYMICLNILHINYLHVDEKYRNNGLATFLLIIASNINNNLGIEYIELDNMCDIINNNNIYIKLGMKYKNYIDSPEELIDRTYNIMTKWKYFKNKYNNNLLFN